MKRVDEKVSFIYLDQTDFGDNKYDTYIYLQYKW